MIKNKNEVADYGRKGKYMSSTIYEGMVGMKPEFKNRHFFSGDDDFTYQIPKVYFECMGECDHSDLAFDYRDDSVMMLKGDRIVRYTERNCYEILMTNLNGRTEWVNGGLAECLGWDVEYIKDIRPTTIYWVEEFDLSKSEKKRYKVVLESTSKLEDFDARQIKKIIENNNECAGEEYVLTNLDN